MKLLIIGGTKFLGKHIVLSALKNNHEVTLFHRGETNPEMFSECEKIFGDRNCDIEKLQNRKWDAVIDTSAYYPKQISKLMKIISENTNHYTLISSVSVYDNFSEENIEEDYPVGKIENELTEEITGETYGPLKALCEKVVQNQMEKNSLIVRPGLIVGPDDPTDRFTYWPIMFSQADELLMTNRVDDLMQFIDVRDLAEWIVHAIENNITGIFNVTGPKKPLSVGTFLDICKTTFNFDGKLHLADDEFLIENDISPWTDLPVWVPEEGESIGYSKISIQKALDNGLKFRPLEETLLSITEWFARGNLTKKDLMTGLNGERLSSLITKWKNKKS